MRFSENSGVLPKHAINAACYKMGLKDLTYLVKKCLPKLNLFGKKLPKFVEFVEFSL